MRTSQNFACSYESPECTIFTNNAGIRDNTLTSQVPPPSIRGQRNTHYETGSQYVCFIREVGHYFTTLSTLTVCQNYRIHQELNIIFTSPWKNLTIHTTISLKRYVAMQRNCDEGIAIIIITQNKTQDLYADVREFNEPAREEEDIYSQIKSCGIRNISRGSIQ